MQQDIIPNCYLWKAPTKREGADPFNVDINNIWRGSFHEEIQRENLSFLSKYEGDYLAFRRNNYSHDKSMGIIYQMAGLHLKTY